MLKSIRVTIAFSPLKDMNCRSLLQMIFAMRIRCGVVIVRDDAKFMGYTGRVFGTYDHQHTMIKSLPVKKKG